MSLNVVINDLRQSIEALAREHKAMECSLRGHTDLDLAAQVQRNMQALENIRQEFQHHLEALEDEPGEKQGGLMD